MNKLYLKTYKNEIKKYTTEQLINERMSLINSIEFIEHSKMLKKEKSKDIYITKLNCLTECIKELINKTENVEEKILITKDGLYDGDIVKIKGKEYKLEIIVGKETAIKKNNDTIEMYIKVKNIDDHLFIKRAFDRYKKEIE